VLPPPPPPNQPSVKLLAAAKLFLAKLSGPRTLAVAVSVANVIRYTVDSAANEPLAVPNPLPNHAAVFSVGGGASDILTAPEKETPPVIVNPAIV
jgi:hypothetical protein